MSSRQTILDSAAKLFKEKGFAATSLRDIAKETGIKSASIYHHFASKDEIVIAVLDHAVEVVFNEVRNATAGLGKNNHREKIKQAITAHLRAIFEIDDYNAAAIRIFDQIPPDIARRTKKKRDTYINYWKELLTDAQNSGYIRDGIDISLLRLFIFGAMNWSPQWYKKGRVSIEEVAQNLTETIILGTGNGSS